MTQKNDDDLDGMPADRIPQGVGGVWPFIGRKQEPDLAGLEKLGGIVWPYSKTQDVDPEDMRDDILDTIEMLEGEFLIAVWQTTSAMYLAQETLKGESAKPVVDLNAVFEDWARAKGYHK